MLDCLYWPMMILYVTAHLTVSAVFYLVFLLLAAGAIEVAKLCA